MTKFSNKKGVILLLTFIIMTTLIAITTGFLYMVSIRTRSSGFDLTSAKALWIAEGGIQQIKYNLENGITYPTATTVTTNLGDGNYSVLVTPGVSNIYTLISKGTVDVVSREVTQSIIVNRTGFPDAFDYAVFGNTSTHTLKIEKDTDISGDLYCDGDVEVKDEESSVTGLVYADSVTGDGTYTEAPGPPDPVPTYPTFNTTTYDNAIADAGSPSDATFDGSEDLDLSAFSGSTAYYNKLTVKGSATITGPGTIVTTGDVKLEGSANVSQNVTIISKEKIEVKDDAIVQSGAVLYGIDEVKLKDNANVTGSLLAPVSDVTLEGSATFAGIIYASKVDLDNCNVTVSGSIVANEYEGHKIKAKGSDNLSIIFNQPSFPSSVPTGLPADSTDAVLQQDWDENVPPTT